MRSQLEPLGSTVLIPKFHEPKPNQIDWKIVIKVQFIYQPISHIIGPEGTFNFLLGKITAQISLIGPIIGPVLSMISPLNFTAIRAYLSCFT